MKQAQAIARALAAHVIRQCSIRYPAWTDWTDDQNPQEWPRGHFTVADPIPGERNTFQLHLIPPGDIEPCATGKVQVRVSNDERSAHVFALMPWRPDDPDEWSLLPESFTCMIGRQKEEL